MGSWVEAVAEVEDVLDATDAFWAARSSDSSRVRRFTWECQWHSPNIGWDVAAYHCLLFLLELNMQLRRSEGTGVS